MTFFNEFALVDVSDCSVDVPSLTLCSLARFSVTDAITFLAKLRLIANSRYCARCGKSMRICTRSELGDGYEWTCKLRKKYCSKMSMRYGSFYAKSKLSLQSCILFSYMWAYKFSNQQIVRELKLGSHAVVDYMNFCRQVCQSYCDHQAPIGGVGKYVEIDESCVAKQKHNRGRKKPGSTRWIFGGVERGHGGRCFAVRVDNRKRGELYPEILARILPGTTIISDEWPAYLRMEKHLPMYKHLLICHKRDSNGGFAKNIKLPDGSLFRVHSNKCEGMWAHVKHNIKRNYGTSNALLQSHVSEAVFRLNCKALGYNVFDYFLVVVCKMYPL